jgi:hypothetical protein
VTEQDTGDVATLTLTVTPSAGDTTATVLATSPTGTTSTPTASPNGDRSVWTALLPLTSPGTWVAVWTVTGTGAGVEQRDEITARPVLPVSTTGQRVYATTADLANYLEAAPPEGARRLLRRASRRVDDALLTALYDVDTAGMPTDPLVITALRDATCAQVEYWATSGADPGGADAVYDEVAIGSARLSRRSTGGPPAGVRLCADAAEILRLAVDSSGLPLLSDTIISYC